jgi:lipopolysaccharide transport system permease protein
MMEKPSVKNKSGMKLRYTNRPDTLPEYLGKMWSYRAMISLFARRDLKVKYAQTVLGLAWTVVQPLTGLVIFYLFFHLLVAMPQVPECGYAVFAFSGMTAWYFFSYIVYQGSNSLVNGQELSQKIYFPQLILPLSKVLVGGVDLAVSVALLLLLMLAMQVQISWKILLLPGFMLLNAMVGLSVAIWLSALTVRHRDLQHIVPYIVNFGIWLTPVFFPATIVPIRYHWLLYLNPMAGIVEGYRWSLWGYSEFAPQYVIGLLLAFISLIMGVHFFKRSEHNMMDVI